MIVDITKENLSEIKNPVFRAYAGQYIEIYEDFMSQISKLGLDVDPKVYTQEVTARLDELRQKGAIVRNDNKSVYINSISPSCVACQTSIGSATYFISLQCHRDCFYCFNPNQEAYEIFSKNELDLVKELESVADKGVRIEHLALTGGEPLLHREDTIAFFQTAKQKFPGSQMRLYTSGDHLDQKTLEELKRAGLQEIRISIRMHDLEKGNGILSKNWHYLKNIFPE